MSAASVMERKNVRITDLVWAKMRGYSPWPGLIVAPPAGQNKRDQLYVFFFGTCNYAWVKKRDIVAYRSHYKDEFKKNIKTSSYTHGVKSIGSIYHDLNKEVQLTFSEVFQRAYNCDYSEDDDKNTNDEMEVEGVKNLNAEYRSILSKKAVVVLTRCDAQVNQLSAKS